MSEELLVVLEHLIQTAIQDVLFYQRVIFIQQISLRAFVQNYCRCSRHSLPGQLALLKTTGFFLCRIDEFEKRSNFKELVDRLPDTRLRGKRLLIY
jgi:hypothetical protein